MKLTKWMKSNIISIVTKKKAEDLLDKIAAEFPEYAVPVVRSVNVYVNNQGRIYGDLTAQTYAKTGTMENLREGDKYYEEGVKVYKACEALERTQRELVGEVSSRIDCFNTDRQLIEGWPEIKSHVLNVVGDYTRSSFAIALTYDDINKRLGL